MRWPGIFALTLLLSLSLGADCNGWWGDDDCDRFKDNGDRNYECDKKYWREWEKDRAEGGGAGAGAGYAQADSAETPKPHRRFRGRHGRKRFSGAVPEPTGALLFAFGLLTFAAARRMRWI
jgi:hypothetical protein